jgi:hypothetical protein
MLVNEVQQQQRKVLEQEEQGATQAGKIAAQNERVAAQASEMRDLKQQMTKLTVLKQATQAALRKLQAKDELVVGR